MNFKILILFVAAALVAFVSQTKAASLDEPFEHEIDEHGSDLVKSDDNKSIEHHGLRQKRAVCDLLSFLPVNGNALCAARCIGLNRGFKGGYCSSKAVCTCRK